MRHHAADGGGRKPTENQTVVWETRGNKTKSKARKGQKQNGKGKEEQPSIVPGCKTVGKNNTPTRGLNIHRHYIHLAHYSRQLSRDPPKWMFLPAKAKLTTECSSKKKKKKTPHKLAGTT